MLSSIHLHSRTNRRRFAVSAAVAVLTVFFAVGCVSVESSEPIGAVAGDAGTELSDRAVADDVFVNPILPSGADPWVILHEGLYYYTVSDGRRTIFLSATEDFTRLSEARSLPVYAAEPGTDHSDHVWAPELHFFEGRWYLYFSADGGEIFEHRVFVARTADDDPFGEYEYVGPLVPNEETFNIDGTVWRAPDGQYYCFWSGWTTTRLEGQHIFASAMNGPERATGEPVLISSPEYRWEAAWPHPPVNEAPQIIENDDLVHLVFSASAYFFPKYCLGLLTMDREANPLDPDSWTKYPEPVFRRANEVRGPGHASFTTSPDGTEWWIIYHSLVPGNLYHARMINAQQFTWDEDGYPEFDEPVGSRTSLYRPSGVAETP